MTIEKNYPFIVADADVSFSAYNKLKNITASLDNWEHFCRMSPDDSRDIMLNIINELMMPYNCPEEPTQEFDEKLLDELRAEFEPKFENGHPF